MGRERDWMIVSQSLMATRHRSRMNAFGDSMFVQNAFQMAMTSCASAPGTTRLRNAPDGHQFVLFDRFSDFRLGNVQTMTKRALATSMSVVGSN